MKSFLFLVPLLPTAAFGSVRVAMRALFLLLLLLLPCRGGASSLEDFSPEFYRVVLTGGDTLRARSVKPASFDMVAITTMNDAVRYVSAVRIRAIVDGEGKDWRNLVLESGKELSPAATEERQAQAKRGGPRALCWGGQPRSHCRSFLLTEFGVLVRLDDYPYRGADGRTAITFDLGWMKNISERGAVGFSGHALVGDPTTRLGIRGRYRRWLTNRLSIDVTPGVILGGEDSAIEYSPPGFVLGGAINVRDLVSVTVDAEYARNRGLVDDTLPLRWEDRSDVAWRAGAKLGSAAGLAGAAVLIGLVVVAAASGSFD